MVMLKLVRKQYVSTVTNRASLFPNGRRLVV